MQRFGRAVVGGGTTACRLGFIYQLCRNEGGQSVQSCVLRGALSPTAVIDRQGCGWDGAMVTLVALRDADIVA